MQLEVTDSKAKEIQNELEKKDEKIQELTTEKEEAERQGAEKDERLAELMALLMNGKGNIQYDPLGVNGPSQAGPSGT